MARFVILIIDTSDDLWKVDEIIEGSNEDALDRLYAYRGGGHPEARLVPYDYAKTHAAPLLAEFEAQR